MDLRELYQQVILDHNRGPRNYKEIPDAQRCADGRNPLCGDELKLYLNLDDVGRIEDIGFQGDGCAIFKAAASMMTAAVKGNTVEEANELFGDFHAMVTSEGAVDKKKLGKLAAFGGVREFPGRVKCASLSWHTLLAALEKSGKTVVSTE